MNYEETLKIIKADLQATYGKLLDARGINSGDIDPLTAVELEKAEENLARVVEHWLSLEEA